LKTDTELSRVKLSSAPLAAHFPREVLDFHHTVDLGDREFNNGETEAADQYYSLALIKADLIQGLIAAELQRQEEAERLVLEKKKQAEAELLQQKAAEREQAEVRARETARLLKIEAERAEAVRRRLEKQRQELQQLALKHTVKRGETLPQIAAQADVYGDSSLWPLIYRANRDQISDPAVLWPGQVLRIPRNSDRGDINEARRFASERGLK
jgi:nucleoid-associated protein YgaU